MIVSDAPSVVVSLTIVIAATFMLPDLSITLLENKYSTRVTKDGQLMIIEIFLYSMPRMSATKREKKFYNFVTRVLPFSDSSSLTLGSSFIISCLPRAMIVLPFFQIRTKPSEKKQMIILKLCLHKLDRC